MEADALTRFNIRVYFLLEEKGHLLVSDEIIAGRLYTKFPGGGLELGEGISEACRREAREELGQEITLINHLYTTEFFVRSKFHPTDQVVAVYYAAQLISEVKFTTSLTRHNHLQPVDGAQSLRWVPLHEVRVEEFSFESDQAAFLTFRSNR